MVCLANMSYRTILRRKLLAQAPVSKLLTGASWAFIFKLLGLLSGYLFALVVARTLGAEAWGTFSLCLSIVTIGAVYTTLGTDSALLRLTGELREQENPAAIKGVFIALMRIVLPMGIAITTLLYLLAPWMSSQLLNKPHLAPYLRIMSLSIVPISLIFLSAQGLRGLSRIGAYAFLNLVARHFFPLLVFLLLIPFYQTIETLMFAYFIGLALVALMSLATFMRLGDFQNTQARFEISYKVIFAISFPLLLASSAQFIKGWIDTIMLGIMVDEAQLGIYSIAFKLSTILSIPLVAINAAIAPRFAAAFGRNDQQALREQLQQSAKMVFMLSLPLTLALVAAPTLWLSVFGTEFKVGTTALLILILGRAISALSGSVGIFLQMTGHQQFFQRVTICVMVTVITLNYLLIPRMGINGAAISTCVGVALQNLIYVWYIKSRYGFISIYYPFKQVGA